MGPPKIPLAERFWIHVDKSGGLDACWPWTAYRTKTGYGHVRGDDRTTRKASRVAWELTTGKKLDTKTEIRHTCDNPPCCNPGHLLTGSRQDNVNDMMIRGRHRSVGLIGEKNPRAKLTEFNVREIRSRLSVGDLLTDIAADYSVSDVLIGAIKRNKIWRHV